MPASASGSSLPSDATTTSTSGLPSSVASVSWSSSESSSSSGSIDVDERAPDLLVAELARRPRACRAIARRRSASWSTRTPRAACRRRDAWSSRSRAPSPAGSRTSKRTRRGRPRRGRRAWRPRGRARGRRRPRRPCARCRRWRRRLVLRVARRRSATRDEDVRPRLAPLLVRVGGDRRLPSRGERWPARASRSSLTATALEMGPSGENVAAPV